MDNVIIRDIKTTDTRNIVEVNNECFLSCYILVSHAMNIVLLFAGFFHIPVPLRIKQSGE